MSYLKQANIAFRDKEYSKAIKFYKKAIFLDNCLKDVISFNIELSKIKEGKVKGKIFTEEFEFDTEEINGLKKNSAILSLDNVNHRFINGWAIDLEKKDTSILLGVFLDGEPYSLVETYLRRDDVAKVYGGDGYFGYRAEINPYINFSNETIVSIQPVSHILDKSVKLTNKKNMPAFLKGTHYSDVNKKAKNCIDNYLIDKCYEKKSLKVSVIILNLNGGVVLKECISSVLKWNNSCEIIVVDHASTDCSIEILEAFGLDRIKLVKREKNYSYSDSNNLGAKEASGDILVFLNNDIILTSDSISALANVVANDEFGLLGIKLLDLPRSCDFKLDKSIKVNQHLGVHFNGLSRKETIEAFELRSAVFIDLNKGILQTPAVTAAMFAISKADFNQVDGFSDKYFYGQEDVDFCLRYQDKIDKKIGVLLSEEAYHIRGLSRAKLSQKNRSYIADNRKTIQVELGQWFRKNFRIGVFNKPGFWNQKPLSVAMIVSEVSFETDKADFFTAKELGDAFEESENIVVGYFGTGSEYDMSGYDIIIVFIDGFDPRILSNLSPHVILIGWARNWFDRWCDRVWIEYYDYLYVTSEKSHRYMQSRLKRKVGLLRIAASNACIKNINGKDELASDYVFTGSFFKAPREITDLLLPENIPFNFKLFGHNWTEHEKFKKYTSGPLSYRDIPSVYASTKLVVDDANIATKKWGSLNCRVFDSIAMGVPCVTNNLIGVAEVFDSDFPTYQDNKVNQIISDLLHNDNKRKKIADKFKNIVLKKHTYQNRRDSILSDIRDLVAKKSIAIKIAAPDFERAKTWGDYYFAIELRRELEILGYKVRIDCLSQWYADRCLNDDINIVLRGLNDFNTRKDQVNLLWIISHPDLVSVKELENYDHTFMASEFYTEKLMRLSGFENISFLPQASAFSLDKLNLNVLKHIPTHEILFVGNSRNEYREVVKWCVESGLPISVYGQGWEQFIPEEYIKGGFIENKLLPYYYNKAEIVLNDHWSDMKEHGFISNRIYDVLSSGGDVLTDYVQGIDRISDRVSYYIDKYSFISILEERMMTKKKSYEKHECNDSWSFSARVNELNKIIAKLAI